MQHNQELHWQQLNQFYQRNDALLAEIERQRTTATTFKADTDFQDAMRLLQDEITKTEDRQKEIKMLPTSQANKQARKFNNPNTRKTR